MEEIDEKKAAGTAPTGIDSMSYGHWDTQCRSRHLADYRHRHYHRAAIITPLVIVILLIVIGVTLVGNRANRRHSMIANRTYIGQQLGGVAPNNPGGGMMGRGNGYRNYHGVVGAVTKIEGNTVTIRQNDQDVSINITSSTSIYKSNGIAKQADIHERDVIFARGEPGSNGVTQARSIRIN